MTKTYSKAHFTWGSTLQGSWSSMTNSRIILLADLHNCKWIHFNQMTHRFKMFITAAETFMWILSPRVWSSSLAIEVLHRGRTVVAKWMKSSLQVSHCLALETLMLAIKGEFSSFVEMWDSFMRFLKKGHFYQRLPAFNLCWRNYQLIKVDPYFSLISFLRVSTALPWCECSEYTLFVCLA